MNRKYILQSIALAGAVAIATPTTADLVCTQLKNGLKPFAEGAQPIACVQIVQDLMSLSDVQHMIFRRNLRDVELIADTKDDMAHL
jgi:hypothetical protein